MKIALIGTRGIPAAYSGFETAVEHLSREFAARGHHVTVYCRPHMTERRNTHAGARLVHLPTIRNKYLDTLAHTTLSTGHMITRERPDVAIYFIAGNAPVVPVARLAGVPSVLQIDGMDSERAKWPRAARAIIRQFEHMSAAAATIAVTDSESVADLYEERFGRRLLAIPYGADLPDPETTGALDDLGLEPGRYLLFVGRLVPENNAHLLVQAYAALDTDWPLVVVGDAPYAEDYIAGLKAGAPDGVLFPGYVFGDGYAELVRNCGVMCAPTEVGGTHPVIIEAMSAGAAMVVSDHAPNVEVVGDTAATFSLAAAPASLAGVLSRLISDPERRRQLGESASARAATRFGWSTCADRYLMLAGEISARGA
ncbi:MAG: glycosyltransferase family 4 protein [Miltoncostaeaceae bacterium]